MEQGWIKLHRALMDKLIWIESTPEQKAILITILMMANHKENEWEWNGERYKIQPGQFITSLEVIARNAGKGISIQNVRTALNRFEKFNFLTNKSTNKNRLITIVNWGLYQSHEYETNKQTNKQLTSNQQATNKQLTTNKNEKNVKNEKNEKNDNNNLPRKRTKRIYEPDSDEMKLVDFFISEIRKNDQKFKEPNKQKWADEFRKIIELDKRDKKEIAQLIRWVQQDDFERANVLSPTKLRKRYASLLLKMNRPQKAAVNGKVERVPDWFKSRNMPQVETQENEVIDFEAERQKILAKLEGG